jgi:hypothetical protein
VGFLGAAQDSVSAARRPNSDIIRSYGVLTIEAIGFTKGMARLGYFYVSPDFIRSSLRAMGVISLHRI